MQDLIAEPLQLAQLCAQVSPEAGIAELEKAINGLKSKLDFKWVMTRGGWHRLGGVIDADYNPISKNIAQWAESESGGDIDELVANYVDKGYFATRLAGKSHYFTLISGDKPEDFVQLEIEELQEVLDRPLLDRDWFPDSLEEFLDPLDYTRLEPELIGKPFYLFRRITPVNKLLAENQEKNRSFQSLSRFLKDWQNSSAGSAEAFCRHWVLELRQYMDSDGERRNNAKPVCTYIDQLPQLPEPEQLQGPELANAIHSYDRELGFPFAWYFIMLSSKSSNYSLAEAVLSDQKGAFDYLAAKDIKVLYQWEERPYGV